MEYLIVFIIAILAVAAGIFLFQRGEWYNIKPLEYIGFGLGVVGGLVVIIYSIIFIGSAMDRIEQRQEVYRIPYLQKQLDDARERNEPLELAAIQQKVLEYNEKILRHKYYNDRDWFYDLFHIDEWDKVKLIQ